MLDCCRGQGRGMALHGVPVSIYKQEAFCDNKLASLCTPPAVRNGVRLTTMVNFWGTHVNAQQCGGLVQRVLQVGVHHCREPQVEKMVQDAHVGRVSFFERRGSAAGCGLQFREPSALGGAM
jgi:hypothetical protein